MTKKYIIKLAIIMIISGIIGAIASIVLIRLGENNAFDFGNSISLFFNNHTIEMHSIILIFVMGPTLAFNYKGRSIYKNIENISDDEMDIIEKKSSKYLDISMTLNSVFLVLNFMFFGMLFISTTDNQIIIILLFMMGSFFVTGVELTTIKFIKKNDERLKGDPTSMKFAKDFVESCDEAQKLKIYKSGYHAFQFSKGMALVLVILTILLNITLNVGGFPVFLSCIFLLVQMMSYSYYAIREEQN